MQPAAGVGVEQHVVPVRRDVPRCSPGSSRSSTARPARSSGASATALTTPTPDPGADQRRSVCGVSAVTRGCASTPRRGEQPQHLGVTLAGRRGTTSSGKRTSRSSRDRAAGRRRVRASCWTTTWIGSRHRTRSRRPARSAGPVAAARPAPRRRPGTGVRPSCQLRSASSTRRPGRSRRSRAASTCGNRAAPMHGVVISGQTALGPWPRRAPIAERAEPTPATISRACRAKTSPAAVRVAGRRLRSISRTPSCALERGDVRTHPRLRAVDLLGRGREPAAVDDREEGLQPVQVHAPEDRPATGAARPRAEPQDSRS